MGLTNDLHGLLRTNIHLVTKEGMVLMGYTHGRFFTSLEAIFGNPIQLTTTLLNLLFKKFQRGANSSGTSGAGIGLWLALRFARQHDGSITIERNTEGGTSVSLQLPLQK